MSIHPKLFIHHESTDTLRDHHHPSLATKVQRRGYCYAPVPAHFRQFHFPIKILDPHGLDYCLSTYRQMLSGLRCNKTKQGWLFIPLHCMFTSCFQLDCCSWMLLTFTSSPLAAAFPSLPWLQIEEKSR